MVDLNRQYNYLYGGTILICLFLFSKRKIIIYVGSDISAFVFMSVNQTFGRWHVFSKTDDEVFNANLYYSRYFV